MLAQAAKTAVKTAIATSKVSAVCCPASQPHYAIEVKEAGLGAMQVETEGLDGRLVRVVQEDARSLIVWPHDLKIGQFKYRPKSGDSWTITLPSGDKIKAECMPIEREKAWRYTDRFQTAYRIHLKVLSE